MKHLPFFLVISGAVFLSGCGPSMSTHVLSSETIPVSTSTIPSTVSSSTTPAPSPASSTAFDPKADRFVILSGTFTSPSATSTLYLTVQDQQIQGTAVAIVNGKQEVRTIYANVEKDGSVRFNDVSSVDFNYNAARGQSELPVVNASGTWSADGSTLDGIMQEQPHPAHPFHLTVIHPADAADLQVYVFKKEWRLSDRESCSFERAYPIVAAAGPVSASAADLMNQTFKERSMWEDGTDDLNQAADRYIASCRQDLQSLHQEWPTSTDAILNYASQQHIQVTYDEHGLLSVLSGDIENSGGAHPAYTQYAGTIDLASGHTLSLKDVVQPRHLLDFERLEKRKWLMDRSPDLFDQTRSALEALLHDQRATTTEGQLATFGTLENFYLAPDSLVTFYQEYELGPYSSGILEMRMPYALWKPWARLINF